MRVNVPDKITDMKTILPSPGRLGRIYSKRKYYRLCHCVWPFVIYPENSARTLNLSYVVVLDI
jgi:hypothetical protein